MLSVRNLSRRFMFKYWNYHQKRCRSKKEHWAVERRKVTATQKALNHFDDFYKKVFAKQWPSIRVSLLSPHKYAAVVNNFGDSSETVSYLQNRGAINLKTLLEMEKQRLELEGNVENKIVDEKESIDTLDQTVKRLATTTEQQEISSIYPVDSEIIPPLENKNISENDQEDKISISSVQSTDLSLESSLAKAVIDESRMIDPSLGLTSGSLLEFVPATKLKGLEDFVPESNHYRYYESKTEFPVNIKKEYVLNYPELLNVFMYERGNITSFEQPKRGSTGVLNYYLMDGGSVLPVFALDLKPGDTVLDMCAAPGGKSLLILQTLLSDRLVCNDVKESRAKRINSVLNQYIYDLPKLKEQVFVTTRDARDIDEMGQYDKVLVDVPCTTDRHSLHEDDNNLFNVMRLKERLRLPELQTDLLQNALKLVAPGGTVVYSTCTLSPIQNDGVVHMALQKIWEETKIEVEVRDLSPALEHTKSVFKYGEIGLKYGHLVVPFLPLNFGPLYFCKLVRTK